MDIDERDATLQKVGQAKERTTGVQEGSEQSPSPDLAVSGFVLDATTSEPIQGALIELLRPLHKEFNSLDLEHYQDSIPIGSTVSDAAGRFRINAPIHVPLDIKVSSKGFATAHQTFIFAGDPKTVLLHPGAAFKGRITRKSTNEPLAGVKLRGWDKTRTVVFLGETDTGGNYRFEGLGAGLLTVSVTPTLYAAPNWESIDLVAGQTIHKDYPLGDGVAIFGMVTDKHTGLPIAGAVVGEGWTFRRIAVTDAQGRYRLQGFGGPGVYDVHVRAPGYGKAQSNPGPGKYESPAKDTEVDFALNPANGAVGRVTDSTGKPIPHVYCAAVASKRLRGQQHTDYESCPSDEDGHFAFHSLNAQLPHQVSLRAPGFGVRTYDFPYPESGIVDLGTFVLHKSGSMSGSIVNAEGQPMPTVDVTLIGTNTDVSALRPRSPKPHTTSYTSHRSSQTDSKGHFHFADVAGGSYELRASLRDSREVTASVSLNLAEGETSSDTVLVLDSGGMIEGRVLGPDNQPLVNTLVTAWSASSQNIEGVHTRTGSNGAFQIHGLEPGEYFLRVNVRHLNKQKSKQPVASAAPVRATTGDSQIILYTLDADTLRIKLLNDKGNPYAEGFIQVFEPGTEVLLDQGWSDTEGRFSTPVRPDGQFDIKWVPSMRRRKSKTPVDETPDVLLNHASPGQQEHVLQHP